MMKYIKPEIAVTKFDTEDIITTSGAQGMDIGNFANTNKAVAFDYNNLNVSNLIGE